MERFATLINTVSRERAIELLTLTAFNVPLRPEGMRGRLAIIWVFHYD